MPSLREVQQSDWQALNRLHRWAWFPERSEQGWAWLHQFGRGAGGWVLEDERGVCGYLGNILQDYALETTTFRAATGYSLIVLPRAKGGSQPLLEAFRSQTGVFATSILNGNERSAPIYARNGFDPFPSTWANAKIVWPLAPLTILSERVARTLYRQRRPTRELFAGSSRGGHSAGPRELAALDPWRDGAEIDRFNEELRRPGALIADRSCRALQARYSDPDATLPPVLLGWRHNGHLVALALAQLGKMSECEAPILDIIDLSWLEPEGRGPAGRLLAELRTHARHIGASRLRLSIVNPTTALVAQAVPGGLMRRCHVHAHVRFTTPASDQLPWSPTPYDGDYGFFLRPQPPSTTTSPKVSKGLSHPWPLEALETRGCR